MRHIVLSLLLLTTACFPATERPVGVQDAVLEILVEGAPAAEIDFGEQPAGAVRTRQVTLRNAGGTALGLDALQLLSPSPDLSLVLPEEPTTRLEPDARVTLELAFESLVDSTLTNTLQVLSDDPRLPQLNIPVRGESIGGALRIEPENFTFDAIAIGCEETLDVRIVNDGRAPVALSDVALLPQQAETFWLEGAPNSWPELQPGAVLPLVVRWTPWDPVPDSAALVVASDSPQGNVEADYHGPPFKNGIRDDFVVGGYDLLDLLFVVDVADPDVAVGLQDAAGSLIAELQAEAVDFQIGVLDGTRSFAGPIDGSRPDPVAQLQQAFGAVQPGTADVLDAAVACLVQGTCGWPGRPLAALHVVFVTDRAETSTGAAASALVYDLTQLRGPEASRFSVLSGGAVGCSGLAVAASADGGLTALLGSAVGAGGLVCAADYAPMLAEVADATRPLLHRFPLSAAPDPATIWVDYNAWPPDARDWTYDPVDNAVVFPRGRGPSPGEELVVTYDVDACLP